MACFPAIQKTMFLSRKFALRKLWGILLRSTKASQPLPPCAEENFLCLVWILISFQWVGKIRLWFDLPLPQVSDLLSIMGRVYNHRGPFWQFPHPGIFKKWVMSTLYVHSSQALPFVITTAVLPHHCQLEVKKCYEMFCGFFYQLSTVRGLLGTAGSEQAVCCFSSEPVLKP